MEGTATAAAAAGTPPGTKTRIHVGGLGQSVTSDDLRKVFSAMGTVEGLEIIRSKGRSFAYVDILPSSSNSLTKLFSTYNGCVWKGGKLKLEKAKEHFLTRLKREWAESEAEAEESCQPIPASSSSSSDNPNNKTKLQFSKNDLLKIFFPRLQKVKALPLSGTGKHRYSFQRVQTPALPIHFCDCEEHSGQLNVIKQKEVQHHEEIDSAVNEEELSLMSSVMNKLFERENVSTTAVLAKKRDDFIEPVQGSLSNVEEDDDNDDDDDDLIINVVSNANNPAAMSVSKEQRKLSTKDGAIQRAGKAQKKNILLPGNKRKPLLNKEDEYEVAPVSPQQRRNSQFNESDIDFEENEADDDSLIINVASIGNKGMALSGSRKPAKISSKQKFKSCETQTSEDRLTENEHVQEKDLPPPKKKMRPFLAEERDRNAAVFTAPVEKGKFEIQSSALVVDQTTEQECHVKQSSTGCSWSQKSSWRALVGDRSNSAFSLSNILQNVDTTKEKQVISDGPKMDKTIDSKKLYSSKKKNEKLAISKDLDSMSGKTEMGNMLAEAQPNQSNMEKQLISDGPKVDKTLDSRNEKLATSKDLDGMSGKNMLAEAQPNQTNVEKQLISDGPKVDLDGMPGKAEMGNMLAEAQPNQTSMASSNSGRGSFWLHKSSWIQLVSDKSTSFSVSEILPGTTSTNQELKYICEDVVHSADGKYSNIMEQYNTEPKVKGSTSFGVRSEEDSVQSISESNLQTVENNNNASLPAVENICDSEPQQGFGVGETCSFMRSSASLKELVKTKASLKKGSRKKKQVI